MSVLWLVPVHHANGVDQLVKRGQAVEKGHNEDKTTERRGNKQEVRFACALGSNEEVQRNSRWLFGSRGRRREWVDLEEGTFVSYPRICSNGYANILLCVLNLLKAKHHEMFRPKQRDFWASNLRIRAVRCKHWDQQTPPRRWPPTPPPLNAMIVIHDRR